MIGPLFNLELDRLGDFLLTILPVAILGLLIGGGLGWILAQRYGQRINLPQDKRHSWLVYSPLTPMLVLLSILLPYLDSGLALESILLGLIIVPPIFITGVYYVNLPDVDRAQLAVNRRAILETGFRDVLLIAITYLIGGLLYVFLDAGFRESAADALPDYVVSIPLSILPGVCLGVLIGVVYQRVGRLLEQRHTQGHYSMAIDDPAHTLHTFIDTILTQFHGTSLVTVLAICGLVLPFTTLPRITSLAVLLIPPIASVTLSVFMSQESARSQPGIWENMRVGLWGITQITLGYLVGTGMLFTLEAVNTWMLDQPDEVEKALLRHLDLTFTALGISALLGIVGGIFSSRFNFIQVILTNLGNIGRTIPSLAVLALALPLFGVGFRPSIIALIFIGTLPILVNTTVGIIQVTHDIKEAARGMGMNEFQVLVRVEIPIALPVIIAGVRTSAVLIVASATLAGFIGGGGLGALIIRGDGSGREDILFTGAIMATILAIFLEYLFGWLETILTPRGLRSS